MIHSLSWRFCMHTSSQHWCIWTPGWLFCPQNCLNQLQGDTKPIRRLVEARFDEIKSITESKNPILDIDLSDWWDVHGLTVTAVFLLYTGIHNSHPCSWLQAPRSDLDVPGGDQKLSAVCSQEIAAHAKCPQGTYLGDIMRGAFIFPIYSRAPS